MKRWFVLVLLAVGCASPPAEPPVASAPVEVLPTAAEPAPAASPAPAAASPRVEIPRTVAARDPFASPLDRGPAVEEPPARIPAEEPARVLHRPQPRPAQTMPDVELTGILLSPAGNRALVREAGGTHVVGVGDRVDGFRVTAIEAARITLDDGTRRVHLQLAAAEG